MQYRSTIVSAVPISTIANRATSGSSLHHQQQQNKGIRERWRTKSKMKLRPSTFVMSMVMAQMRCTTAHSPSRSLFLSDGGDNNSNIVSFDFRLTIAEKISSMRRVLDPGVLIPSQVTRSDSISCQIKLVT